VVNTSQTTVISARPQSPARERRIMARWSQTRHRMPANHSWKAKPGHQIFVAQMGAVRFDIPSGWLIIPGPSSYKLCDRQPPDDECTLEVSFIELPPVDLSDLPVTRMLREVTAQETRGTQTWRGEIVEERRGELEIAQFASRWTDTTLMREACSHIAIGRRQGIQALLTCDYWLDDAKQFGPVWLTVMETLRVAEWVTPDGRPAPPPALPDSTLPPGLVRDRRTGRA
jgi:hypothetical protein